MRIEIPHSAHPTTRVNVLTPGGPICADFMSDHKFFDVELPEGVSEDEVGVIVQYLNNGYMPVDFVVLKEPKPKPKPIEPPAVTDEPSVEDCECKEPGDACSKCDPEDEIAESNLDE